MNEDILSQLYGVPITIPGQLATPIDEPVYDPSQVPVADETQYVAPMPVSTGTSRAASLGVSTSGVNEPKAKRFVSAADRELDAARAQTVAEAQQYKTGYDEVAGLTKKSLVDKSRIDQQKADVEAQASFDLARMREQHMVDEQAVMEQSRAQHQSYMTEYNSQLQSIRATNINPGKLFADMTGGEKAGMLVTAFVHDFLGAKGIKTSSMDTFNRAIERSVDAQIQNLNNKRAALGEFKQMYDMQRQQSASEEEARLRMQGFALQAFNDEVTGKLAQFGSDYAKAQLSAALAEVNKSILDNKIRLDEIARSRYNNDANIILAKRRDAMNAAQEAAKISVMRKNAETSRMEAEARLKPAGPDFDKLREQAIRAEGGKVLGFVPDKETRQKFQERVTGAGNLSKHMKELTDMQRELGSYYQGKGATVLEDVHKAKLNSLASKIRADYVKSISGAATTDAETKRLADVITVDNLSKGFFQGGGLSQYVNSQFNHNLLADMQEEVNNNVINSERMGITPQMEERLVGGGNFTPFDAERTEAAVNSEKPLNLISAPVKLAGQIDDDEQTVKHRDTLGYIAQEDAQEYYGDEVKSRVVPDYFEQLSKIKDMARAGDADAMKVLGNYAYNTSDSYTGSDRDVEIRNMARWFLTQIDDTENKEYVNRKNVEKQQARNFADEYLYAADEMYR